MKLKEKVIMSLLETIDELRANSVSPERFESVFGVSIEEQMSQLMAFVREQEEAASK